MIQELFPALHRADWDVLIGHFLGVVLFLFTRHDADLALSFPFSP